MSHSPQKRPTSTHRAVFSDHCYSLCGSTVAHTSAGSDPATGGRRKCRTPWISPCTVFKTGSETARIHLPYSLEVLHRAPSDSNSFGLETRTPLHLLGLPSPRFFTIIRFRAPRASTQRLNTAFSRFVRVAAPVFLPSYSPQGGIRRTGRDDHGIFQPLAGASVASVFSLNVLSVAFFI